MMTIKRRIADAEERAWLRALRRMARRLDTQIETGEALAWHREAQRLEQVAGRPLTEDEIVVAAARFHGLDLAEVRAEYETIRQELGKT